MRLLLRVLLTFRAYQKVVLRRRRGTSRAFFLRLRLRLVRLVWFRFRTSVGHAQRNCFFSETVLLVFCSQNHRLTSLGQYPCAVLNLLLLCIVNCQVHSSETDRTSLSTRASRMLPEELRKGKPIDRIQQQQRVARGTGVFEPKGLPGRRKSGGSFASRTLVARARWRARARAFDWERRAAEGINWRVGGKRCKCA